MDFLIILCVVFSSHCFVFLFITDYKCVSQRTVSFAVEIDLILAESGQMCRFTNFRSNWMRDFCKRGVDVRMNRFRTVDLLDFLTSAWSAAWKESLSLVFIKQTIARITSSFKKISTVIRLHLISSLCLSSLQHSLVLRTAKGFLFVCRFSFSLHLARFKCFAPLPCWTIYFSIAFLMLMKVMPACGIPRGH